MKSWLNTQVVSEPFRSVNSPPWGRALRAGTCAEGDEGSGTWTGALKVTGSTFGPHLP